MVVVLPSVWPAWTDACLATMHSEFRARTLIVDNTVENRGVAASWNLGVDRLEAEHAGWLVLLSAAVRFGPPGGLDFLARLDEHPSAIAVEAHPHFGWHCIGIAGHALRTVGRFDENFWPGYWEDNDWSHRARCVYNLDPEAGYWTKVPVDATDAGWGHALEHAGVVADPDALMGYYRAKWGGLSPDEPWCTPYGDPGLPIDYQGPPPGMAGLLPPRPVTPAG